MEWLTSRHRCIFIKLSYFQACSVQSQSHPWGRRPPPTHTCLETPDRWRGHSSPRPRVQPAVSPRPSSSESPPTSWSWQRLGWAGSVGICSGSSAKSKSSSHLFSFSLFCLQVFRETWSRLRLISTSELWSFLHSSNTLPLLLSLLHQRQDFPRRPAFSICKLIFFCLLSVFCYQNGIIFLPGL